MISVANHHPVFIIKSIDEGVSLVLYTYKERRNLNFIAVLSISTTHVHLRSSITADSFDFVTKKFTHTNSNQQNNFRMGSATHRSQLPFLRDSGSNLPWQKSLARLGIIYNKIHNNKSKPKP